jgi:MFS family permease
VSEYRDLIVKPGVLPWVGVTLATRLAVAVVPLGSVLASHASTGSYPQGGLVAGAYAAGEALLAPIMGHRFAQHPLRHEVIGTVLAEALALAVLIWALSGGHISVAALASFTAGGVASGLPGGLRSYINVIAGRHRQAAVGFDSVLNQTCWTLGPALASTLAFAWFSTAPLVIITVGLILAVATTGQRLPAAIAEATPDEALPGRRLRPHLHVLTQIWPSVATSALVMGLMAVLDITLPGTFSQLGASPAWTGPVLAGLAGVSILASAVYGSRRWPGRPHLQALIFTAFFTTLLGAGSLSSHPAVLASFVIAAGAAQAPAMTGRNLAVGDDLPQRSWPLAFSILYAAGGVGYSIASIATAALLTDHQPPMVLTVLATAAIVTTVLLAALERSTKRAVPR